MRSLLLVLLVAWLLFPLACGSNSTIAPETMATTGASAHQLPEEVQQKIVADTVEDLNLVASTGADATALPQALTGPELEKMRTALAADLAQGKYKKREYKNIKVTLQEYSPPIAQMSAEFDDASYYVDAKTGAALEAPSGEHKTYALAMVEEGNRWKIKYVLSPIGTDTQQASAGVGQ